MQRDSAVVQPAPEMPGLSLIQSDELRAILGGVSDMWLWRKLKNGVLPKPLVLSGRRFWRRDEITRFIEAESAKRALSPEPVVQKNNA